MWAQEMHAALKETGQVCGRSFLHRFKNAGTTPELENPSSESTLRLKVLGTLYIHILVLFSPQALFVPIAGTRQI